MKRKIALLCLFFLISFEIVASDTPQVKEFFMTFLKRGETSWGISKVNENGDVTTEPLDGDIEFSLWDPNSNKNPKASFGVYWNIYLGDQISLYLDFNSSEDRSGQYMLSSGDNNLNYSAQAKLSNRNSKSNNVGGSTVANDATLYILEDVVRPSYTLLSGTALIELTLIPNQTENNTTPYIMDGTYEGYVFLTLETE